MIGVWVRDQKANWLAASADAAGLMAFAVCRGRRVGIGFHC